MDWSDILTILGMACITLLTRSFFLFSRKPWAMPHWAQRGLQYAPIAAMSAVVVPEVLVSQGQLIATWADARLYGAAAGVAAYYWRRDVLITIIVGMAIYLPLRLGLGW